MKYATVCSGVEAVSLGWDGLDFTPIFFSEIEKFPKALLYHRFPSVPDLGDMTKIDGATWRGMIDIFWGSTPCQSFSLAGKRESLSDDRGALTLKFCELADEINPPIVCWENVKGSLSAKGNAFGCLLGALSGESMPLNPSGGKWTNSGYVLGPKRIIAWRLFNSEYSGVAQRRERVFIVACTRESGIDPREILFEEPTGEKISKPSRSIPDTHEEGTSSYSSSSPTQRAYALAIRGRDNGEQMEIGGEISNCLRTIKGYSSKAFVLIDGSEPIARQLTPLECERVMGFPEGWTDIPFGDDDAARDDLRYTAIGNSIAVPDVRWIGQRIKAIVEKTSRTDFC